MRQARLNIPFSGGDDMDDKKAALFSKAFLILYEGFCDEHGSMLIGSGVDVIDSDSISNVEIGTSEKLTK